MSHLHDAVPARYFANPPYRAELLDSKNTQGLAGVMNSQGFNCLTFSSKPGAVATDIQTATDIAEHWNSK